MVEVLCPKCGFTNILPENHSTTIGEFICYKCQIAFVAAVWKGRVLFRGVLNEQA